MTMTESTTTTTDVSFFIEAGELARALSNAKLFLGKPERPILHSVRVDVADGTITFEATDSYALLRERLSVDHDAPPISFRIDGDELDNLIRALKAHAKAFRYSSSPVTLRLVERAIVVEMHGSTVTLRDASEFGEWPRTDSLWPAGEPTCTDTIGLAPFQLVRLGKVDSGSGGKGISATAARFAFWGSLKAAKVSIGEAIDILVMPVR